MRTSTVLSVLFWSVAGAAAQETPAPSGSDGKPPALQRSTDRGIANLAKRYRLDDVQKELVRALLKEHFSDFVEKYGAEMKAITVEAAAFHGKLDDPDSVPAGFVKLQERAARVSAEQRRRAAKAVEEFRAGILNEEQRVAFDLHRSPALREFSAFMGLAHTDFLRSQGLLQGERYAVADPAVRARRIFTGAGFLDREWELWLEATAKSARMTQEQAGKGRLMMESAILDAAAYRRAKEGEISRIAGELADQLTSLPTPEKRIAVERAAVELTAPLEAIGAKFKSDVLKLLSEEQRKSATKP